MLRIYWLYILQHSFLYCFVEGYGPHRDLHVQTHTFPTRRSSELAHGPRAPGHRPHVAGATHGEDRHGGDVPAERDRVRHLPEATSGMGTVVRPRRSEEHPSELQSLMRISYAVFCLKKNNSAQLLTQRLPPPYRVPPDQTEG